MNQINPAISSSSFYGNLNRAAQTDYVLFLEGAKKIGKELCAEAIHDLSERKDHLFFSVNCYRSGIADFGLELLTPVRRDITSYINSGRSLPETLKNGTVLLNELEVLDVEAHRKVIEYLTQTLNLRLIINASVNVGKVRLISTIDSLRNNKVLKVPSLLNRPRDIRFFANYFLAKAALEWNRRPLGISEEAMELLTRYVWPHNLFELKDAIRQAVLVCIDDELIQPDLLPENIKNFKPSKAFALKEAIRYAEQDLVARTLAQTKNNIRKAAALLQISRKTLYSKLSQYQQQQ